MRRSKKEFALHAYRTLDAEYPGDVIFLTYDTPFQLLISVILSAMTTDRQVNAIAEELFSKYPDPNTLAAANQEDVEHIIKSTGFFHSKAKNIIETAEKLNDSFSGRVPASMKELVSLSGVGRKSANVILGAVYNLPAIIVDTHFSRVVRRFGLTSEKDPSKIEQALQRILPADKQYRFSMIVNKHGRIYCHARKPECTQCPLAEECLKIGVS